jgi:cyclic beta-1,2-glucan synthetase
VEEDQRQLRRLSRRTWGFFERFVGPEDHWLPPDHYQESPVGIVAHQTSPTNIGLLFTSTLAAFDLGYLDQPELATRLLTTLDTMDQLEHHRGHLLNWYDTVTLQPLRPRYVSTVDSGNLAACLMVIAQACHAMGDAPVVRRQLWQGYLDALDNLIAAVEDVREPRLAFDVRDTLQRLEILRDEVAAAQDDPAAWFGLFERIAGPFWRDVSQPLARW